MKTQGYIGSYTKRMERVFIDLMLMKMIKL